MLYTIIVALLCISLGAFLGVQVANYQATKKESHRVAIKDYNEHIVNILWRKGRRIDFSQVEQETVMAYCEYCVNHNIRKTDIRMQLFIKSLIK